MVMNECKKTFISNTYNTNDPNVKPVRKIIKALIIKILKAFLANLDHKWFTSFYLLLSLVNLPLNYLCKCKASLI